MTKKENLRKIWFISSFIWLTYVAIEFISGKLDIASSTFMIICYILITLTIAITLIVIILEEVITYKVYKHYKIAFEYLKSIHRERYKLYFTGKTQDIQTYSRIIEKLGLSMINVGEYYISKGILNEKQLNQVQIMLEQTQKMLTTTAAI